MVHTPGTYPNATRTKMKLINSIIIIIIIETNKTYQNYNNNNNNNNNNDDNNSYQRHFDRVATVLKIKLNQV